MSEVAQIRFVDYAGSVAKALELIGAKDKLPQSGLITIALLWLAILATVSVFWRVSRPAAILMLPYLAWVTLASCLNLALWRLNP